MLGGKSKRAAAVFIAVACIISFTTVFSNTAKRLIEVTDIPGKVMYQDKNLSAGFKLFSYNNEIYLPISILKNVLNKDIENDKQGGVIIKDLPDAAFEALKADAAQKDAKLKEMNKLVGELQTQLATRKASLEELEARINKEYEPNEGLTCKTLLSGDEYDVRVRIEIDMDFSDRAWNKMNNDQKNEMLEDICSYITEEYDNVKITGTVKDIARSRDLMHFYNTSDGKIRAGTYKTTDKLSGLEEKFNSEYDNTFSGIHLTYKLSGNENEVCFTACIQGAKYGTEWSRLSDSTIRNTMQKLANEISSQFRDAYVSGSIYDTDSETLWAEAHRPPKESFDFDRKE